jgi:hypothetical protein
MEAHFGRGPHQALDAAEPDKGARRGTGGATWCCGGVPPPLANYAADFEPSGDAAALAHKPDTDAPLEGPGLGLEGLGVPGRQAPLFSAKFINVSRNSSAWPVVTL